MPPGGPEDKVQPEVLSSSPEQGSINVPLETDVTIEFSEFVNCPSVEASLYLSPEPGRRLRYRWSGRKLTLDYLDPLPEQRTIVVTVGALAKDLQGNTLENSFTIAFSTGDHIDRGEISGIAALPEGVRSLTITAYIVTDSIPNPMTDAPDYRMQTKADGSFQLSYLSPGKYRLFALDDRNLDGLWSPAAEWIGTASQDVRVDEGLKPYLTFSPTLQDTTPFSILRARQLDKKTISTRFSRDAFPDQLSIADQSGGQVIIHSAADTTASASWLLFIEKQLSGDSAELVIELGDSSFATKFAVQSRPDTAHPAIARTIPQNRSRSRFPQDSMSVVFSEPITYKPNSDTLLVQLREDTTELTARVVQTDAVTVTVYPEEPTRAGVNYSLKIPNSFITDRSDNIWRDSLWTMTWYNYPADSLGTINGLIRTSETGPWLVELYLVRGTEPEQTVFTTSSFEFSGFPAGDYRLRVIRDVNANQKFDQGQLQPFEFSEPFEWHPDTISVRPRWTEEIDFLWTIAAQP